MKIPIFGPGLNSKSSPVTAKKLTNLYCEIRPVGEKTGIVAYGTPGRSLFTTFGDTPCRGAYVIGERLFIVHRGTLWEVNNAGTQTSRGTLNSTTGRVTISDNGIELFIGDGPDGYTLTLATNAFAQVADVDFPGASSSTFQDQYIIVVPEDSGRFYISGIADATSWDSLDFATAESSPDNLVACIADHNEICLFGQTNTEFWANAANGSADFPYQNIRGATIPYGLAAKNSLVKYNDSLAFLGKNEMGQVQVFRLQGHTAIPISNQDLDSIINEYLTVSDATAFAYMWFGHPMYQINFPTAGESWLYDSSTQIWSSVSSNGGRDKGEIHFDYLNKAYVTDYENGNVYSLESDIYTDNGDEIVRELITANVASPDLTRFPIGCLRLDVETGTGTTGGQGSEPQVMLQISRDGGRTWGSELWADLGALGHYKPYIEWRRLGSASQWTFKIRVTDPVKTTFIAAMINPQE